MNVRVVARLLGFIRLTLGWTFAWAFLDKLFGLGFSTTAERAWIVGGSPTAGFLTNAVKGPFVDVFHGLAGSPTVDWLFMLGLAGIGFALLAGVATRLAGYAGATLLIMMYLALMFPTTNPFLDEHLIYAGLLIGVAHAGPGAWAPLAGWWKKSPLSKFPFLR